MGFTVAMISVTLTPSACSSSSARPVLRTNAVQVIEFAQSLFDADSHFVGGGQRRAGGQENVDLDGPFVERRKKIALQLQQAPASDRDCNHRDGENWPGETQAGPDDDRRQSP